MSGKNISENPGLYLHIPFCDTKCGYCDFYSITNHSSRPQFVEILKREIKQYTKAPFINQPFDTIYFGGGTPSLLEPHELESILSALYASYKITDDCEITIEANPGTLTEEKLRFYKTVRINRLSIGIQSFIDEELKLLGRIHDSRQAIKTFELARMAGFNNIGVDLIFATPRQTLESWLFSLNKAIEIQPDHISAYNLIFEPGTPFYKMLMKGQMQQKSENEELAFFTETIEKLQNAGYLHYEVSNYARGGENYSRHNYKYWTHTNYLSFGPSAHSYWNKKRWSNVRALSRYLKNIEQGQTAVDFDESLSRETMIFERIMLGLRTKEGIDLKAFETNFEESFIYKYPGLNKELIENKFAVIENDRFRLTAKGLMICDEILPRFAPN
ncbi:MAG: radical SAM family heme chaperone HemW [Calditrichaeota bacterium]|nr:radical SAM family heme chaperone HemW [Calditrichota bacterium]